MRFRLRDVFWMMFIIALGCLLWRTRTHTQKQAMEARFYRSASPPIELIDEPLENVVAILEAKHGVSITVDWPSVKKATVWLEPTSKVTHNLQDGSLSWAIERIFFGHAMIEGTENGLLIRGRDPERDGPAKPDWETRHRRKLKTQEQP
jgi:exoribonuclease II